MAVWAEAYTLPRPAFGPGSKGYQPRTRTRNKTQEDGALGIEALRIDTQADSNNHGAIGNDSSEDEGTSTATGSYVGAGSYF